MDPNACLMRWLAATEAGDMDEASDAAIDLECWLARGGFAPDWNACGVSRARFYDVLTEQRDA